MGEVYRVGEVRAGTTSPIPEHKGFMLQQLSEIHPLTPAVFTTSPIPEHKGFMLQQLSEIHPLTPAV